jgi:hypothetical protein
MVFIHTISVIRCAIRRFVWHLGFFWPVDKFKDYGGFRFYIKNATK